MSLITDPKDFYIATTDDNGDDVIYSSQAYKMSELEMLNLIKICLVEQRNKSLGRKLLYAYKDAIEEKEAIKRLNMIGIKEENGQPRTTTKATRK